MFVDQWLPWVDSPTPGAMNSNEQDQELSSGCFPKRKTVISHHIAPVVGLSTLCFLLLVICVALSVMYTDVSDTKPEWESLISDYKNISERYVTVNTHHNDLKKDNKLLKEHNIWLEEETKLLNKSLVKLKAINYAMSVENTKLQEQLADLTQQRDQLVQSSAEQEDEKLNKSQTIAHLFAYNAELREETQQLTRTNILLRHELSKAEEHSQKLLELNERLREELRGVEELQKQNQNLSWTLAEERQDAAEREQSRRLEVEQMEAQMSSVKEALDSLDLYCPVVNLTTKERMCKKCHDDWRHFQTKCYYFSSQTLTWSSSRAWCRTKGGDLLIINSEEEQSFVFASSQTVDQAGTRLWVGMTDTEKEGEWKWVDGSHVTSGVQFWLSRSGMETEPDDWKADDPLGEDCGHIDTTVTALESWMDGSCKIPYRWICEMNV